LDACPPNSFFLEFFIRLDGIPYSYQRPQKLAQRQLSLSIHYRLFLAEIFEVCDPTLALVHRPLNEIEATRLRRKWHPVFGRAGAQIIYNTLYPKLHAGSKSYISVPYESFLTNLAIQGDLLSFCSMSPTSSELIAARNFLRVKWSFGLLC
jgi:hypothetical protein